MKCKIFIFLFYRIYILMCFSSAFLYSAQVAHVEDTESLFPYQITQEEMLHVWKQQSTLKAFFKLLAPARIPGVKKRQAGTTWARRLFWPVKVITMEKISDERHSIQTTSDIASKKTPLIAQLALDTLKRDSWKEKVEGCSRAEGVTFDFQLCDNIFIVTCRLDPLSFKKFFRLSLDPVLHTIHAELKAKQDNFLRQAADLREQISKSASLSASSHAHAKLEQVMRENERVSGRIKGFQDYRQKVLKGIFPSKVPPDIEPALE